ncbi:MAG: hypothetical protein V7646_2160 [Pseudonocardia sp.]
MSVVSASSTAVDLLLRIRFVPCSIRFTGRPRPIPRKMPTEAAADAIDAVDRAVDA